MTAAINTDPCDKLSIVNFRVSLKTKDMKVPWILTVSDNNIASNQIGEEELLVLMMVMVTCSLMMVMMCFKIIKPNIFQGHGVV